MQSSMRLTLNIANRRPVQQREPGMQQQVFAGRMR